jgi:putative membrane protein insertion efficiency factor
MKDKGSGIMAKLLIGMILIYRYSLSCFLGRQCRFAPSCSEYGVEAIRKYGAWKGTLLTIRRILRCHPWGGSGYDPVP